MKHLFPKKFHPVHNGLIDVSLDFDQIKWSSPTETIADPQGSNSPFPLRAPL